MAIVHNAARAALAVCVLAAASGSSKVAVGQEKTLSEKKTAAAKAVKGAGSQGGQGQMVSMPGKEGPAIQAVKKMGGNWQTSVIVVHFGVNANEHLTDAQLKELAPQFKNFPNLFRLSFTGSGRLTDEGFKDLVKEIKNLKQLRMLCLNGTGIGDVGLKEVASLRGLRHLEIDYTRVTDMALREVAKLKGLRYLGLDGTQVTDAGLRELKGMKNFRC